MELPLDILREIILILRVNDIKSLCCVHESFYNLCGEKNLWLTKFKEKDLDIINMKINSLSEYICEYRKVSYATYKTLKIINMVKRRDCAVPNYVLWIPPQFLIDDIVLIKDDPIFNASKNINLENYISIDIEIGDKGKVDYYLYDTNNRHPHEYNDKNGIKILTENYDNKKFVISLINKILYYYPLIEICDINYSAVIIHSDNHLYYSLSCSYYDNYDRKIITIRKEYWDECYSKYEELYF